MATTIFTERHTASPRPQCFHKPVHEHVVCKTFMYKGIAQLSTVRISTYGKGAYAALPTPVFVTSSNAILRSSVGLFHSGLSVGVDLCTDITTTSGPFTASSVIRTRRTCRRWCHSRPALSPPPRRCCCTTTRTAASVEIVYGCLEQQTRGTGERTSMTAIREAIHAAHINPAVCHKATLTKKGR